MAIPGEKPITPEERQVIELINDWGVGVDWLEGILTGSNTELFTEEDFIELLAAAPFINRKTAKAGSKFVRGGITRVKQLLKGLKRIDNPNPATLDVIREFEKALVDDKQFQKTLEAGFDKADELAEQGKQNKFISDLAGAELPKGQPRTKVTPEPEGFRIDGDVEKTIEVTEAGIIDSGKITTEMIEEMTDDFMYRNPWVKQSRGELLEQFTKKFEGKEINKVVNDNWNKMNGIEYKDGKLIKKGGGVKEFFSKTMPNKKQLLLYGLSISFIGNWFANDNMQYLAGKSSEQLYDQVKWDGRDPIEAEKVMNRADKLMRTAQIWNDYVIWANPGLWGLRAGQVEAWEVNNAIIQDQKNYITEQANIARAADPSVMTSEEANIEAQRIRDEETILQSEEEREQEERDALLSERGHYDMRGVDGEVVKRYGTEEEYNQSRDSRVRSEIAQARLAAQKKREETAAVHSSEAQERSRLSREKAGMKQITTTDTTQFGKRKRKSNVKGLL